MESINNIKKAFPKTIPVMAGYTVLGMAFGMVLWDAGFGPAWALLMSVFVFAGSMQFVMVPMMAAGVSPLAMLITTLFVNSRHLFYGISFVETFKKMRQYPYMVFSLTDETYSVLCGELSAGVKEGSDEWFFIAILDHAYWVAGSLAGSLLGAGLQADFSGVDFSMTALFAVILTGQVSKERSAGKYAALGAISSVVCLLLLGTERFLLPALIITVGTGILQSKWSQKREA